MKHAILLINLGTPQAPVKKHVRAFLKEFLSDKRVIDLPSIIRYCLLYGIILPFRTGKTTHAYQTVWTENGSPLMQHSVNLTNKLQARLGSDYEVALGMRYGKPSITSALNQLKSCDKITIIPLYPQYSSAASGSSIEAALTKLAKQLTLPSLVVLRDFHRDDSYIQAQAALIKPYLANHDHLLLSYHGLPERHLEQGGCQPLCKAPCPSTSLISTNQSCYRAQCYETSRLLAKSLDLSESNYTTSFQSRLGKTEWIKPYTDSILVTLIQQGVRRLAISCPSFVADCLETIEEIGMRAQEQWHELGGEQLTLIPCLNDNDQWVDALRSMIITRSDA